MTDINTDPIVQPDPATEPDGLQDTPVTIEQQEAAAGDPPVIPQSPDSPKVTALNEPALPMAGEVAAAEQLGHSSVASADNHTISEADLQAHPELATQGVGVGSVVEFGSHTVFTYPTADRSSIVEEKWPRDTRGLAS